MSANVVTQLLDGTAFVSHNFGNIFVGGPCQPAALKLVNTGDATAYDVTIGLRADGTSTGVSMALMTKVVKSTPSIATLGAVVSGATPPTVNQCHFVVTVRDRFGNEYYHASENKVTIAENSPVVTLSWSAVESQIPVTYRIYAATAAEPTTFTKIGETASNSFVYTVGSITGGIALPASGAFCLVASEAWKTSVDSLVWDLLGVGDEALFAVRMLPPADASLEVNPYTFNTALSFYG